MKMCSREVQCAEAIHLAPAQIREMAGIIARLLAAELADALLQKSRAKHGRDMVMTSDKIRAVDHHEVSLVEPA